MTDTQLSTEEAERLADPVEVPQEPTKARGWAPPRGSLKSTLGFVALLLGRGLLVPPGGVLLTHVEGGLLTGGGPHLLGQWHEL